MANICEYCGKELAEGEECTCPQSVLMREMDKQKEKPPVQQAERPAEPQPETSPAAEEPAAQAGETWGQAAAEGPGPGGQWGLAPGPAPRQPSRIRTAFHNIVPFFTQYWKQPGQMIQTACQHQDLPLAMLYLLFFLACSGLFVAVLFQRLAAWVNWAIGMGQSFLQNFLGGILNVGNIAVPVVWMFFAGVAMALVLVLLTALAVFLAGKVGKTGLSYKNSLVVAGLSTLVPSLGLLAATILLFFTLRGAVYALLFAAMAWLFLTALGARRAGGNETGRFQFALLALLAAAAILAGLINGQVMGTAIGRVSVNGVQLDNAFSPYGGYGAANGYGSDESYGGYGNYGGYGGYGYGNYGDYGNYGNYGGYGDGWGTQESDPFYLP